MTETAPTQDTKGFENNNEEKLTSEFEEMRGSKLHIIKTRKVPSEFEEVRESEEGKIRKLLDLCRDAATMIAIISKLNIKEINLSQHENMGQNIFTIEKHS